MWPSLKPTQRVAIVGAINPQSATAVQVTPWIDASQFCNFLAKVGVGAISATGTVDAKIQQAQDAAGTGVKDVIGKAITQLTQAAGNGNQQALINLKGGDLDHMNGFTFFRLAITPAVAAALIYGEVEGFDPHYNTADALAATTVAQIVL